MLEDYFHFPLDVEVSSQGQFCLCESRGGASNCSLELVVGSTSGFCAEPTSYAHKRTAQTQRQTSVCRFSTWSTQHLRSCFFLFQCGHQSPD